MYHHSRSFGLSSSFCSTYPRFHNMSTFLVLVCKASSNFFLCFQELKCRKMEYRNYFDDILHCYIIHDYQKCFTIKNRYLTFLFNGLRCWTLLSVTTSFIVSPSSAMFTASLSSETFSSSSTTALGALAPSDSSPFACCKKICSCSYLFAARGINYIIKQK